ncbi:hypothetical protein Rctr197k_027 [Virus Rctr197k]|nr:hypothetical protein Rctr197k_027 [Virus Rctr197k]
MATENVDFNFAFAPYKEYKPYEGDGGTDTFPFDGFIAVKFSSFRPYFTKDKKYPALKAAGLAEDDDAKGMRVMDDVLCGGKDKNGEDLGRQFVDLLLSSGTALESVHKNAASNVEGSIKAITAQLVGRIAYAEIEADVYDGKETTKVKNWITKERYEQAKLIGAHRRKRRAVNLQANPAAGGGVPLGGPGAANGTTQPAAAGAPAGGSALPML